MLDDCLAVGIMVAYRQRIADGQQPSISALHLVPREHVAVSMEPIQTRWIWLSHFAFAENRAG
jgi:hypothetical protein